jgi:hypothetical protein
MNSAILHVLFVGSADSLNAIRDALLPRGHSHLTCATDFCDLLTIPKQESFEIAILHHMISAIEIRTFSEYIRRRWPCTRILVMCASPEFLDDPLYDEWIPPGYSPEMLLATVERFTALRRDK